MGGPRLSSRAASVASSPSSRDLADVLAALSDLGPPSEIRRHAPELAARFARLDRVLLSSLRSGCLVPEALFYTGGSVRDSGPSLDEIQSNTVAVEYPLIEGELVRRRRGEMVAVNRDNISAHAFAQDFGWTEYLAVPIVLDARVIGFLHGDRATGNLASEDVVALSDYATGFALVFERAVLRNRVRRRQDELRQIADWMAISASEFGDRPIGLEGAETDGRPSSNGDRALARPSELKALLTPRELDVLELMVRGDTNVVIARELVLSAGTVKFHVKNILRKLNAANRAEATARYLHLTLGQRADS
jgi:LuxR family transcriptional regulator, regulator of acetate metabolism